MSNGSTTRGGISTIILYIIFKETKLTRLFLKEKNHITIYNHLLNYPKKFYRKIFKNYQNLLSEELSHHITALKVGSSLYP